jgi:hypothetical protein
MFACSEIVPAIERSIPPVMTTSIWPNAAIPTIAASGNIELNEVLVSVCGATIWQMISSSPVASQIVTNRDEKSRLLATDETPRRRAPEANRPVPGE